MSRTPACEDAGIAERVRELQRERMAAIAGCSCPQRTTAGDVVHVSACPLSPPPAQMASPTQIERVLAAVERLRAERKHRNLPSATELMAEAIGAKAARHLVLTDSGRRDSPESAPSAAP